MNLNQKYRPATFSDVVEQSKATYILQRELETNNIKPAYLFCGKTGGGKSSCSRILAKELNAYTIEIDSASHGGADDIRQLVETIKVKPISHDNIVVILDECHTISNAGMSALLLALEQPPKFVHFILCTTEAQKIPETIKNRCEIFEFLPISKAGIIARLKQIVEAEDIDFDDRGIDYLATIADGSMRQAITYLEQYTGRLETIRKYRQVDKYDSFLNLIFAVSDKRYTDIVKIVNDSDFRFVESFFSFVLSADIICKTGVDVFGNIPDVFVEDIINLKTKDRETIKALRNVLLNLQYEGRNNPIIKQLLVAELYQMVEG